ncbi:MAG TPA: sulfate permease [Gemmatimonadaceae bacterium]|nr:sulfate permease [Gemmatimonadaceae bacterium]
MLVPKSLTTLKTYNRSQFAADAVAGVIVGVVALPLAIAFAIASGVTPDRGLYTAIVAGFLISAFGGSRVQIGGPTGAFVVIVYGIVQRYGLDGLTVATLMAGFILVIFGLARLGAAIKFIPHPVVVGFTSGIAVIIFTSQVNDLLGLKLAKLPAAFVPKWQILAQHLNSVDGATLGIALSALAIMIFWPRVSRRIPGPFVALIVTTVIVRALHVPVDTIGTRFGAISASLPHPVLLVTFDRLTQLIMPAFTIALLGAVESLLSAVVADGMIGGRHRSNMELVAQGIANIASPLFGGIPATGAIARTATNVKNGGRTPVAGMIHALTLLLITLAFGRWAALIPMATLAAILVVVSYHMSEWRTFRSELTAPKSDILVLLATFSLTVLVDLTVAIEVGMVLAAFLFMYRMAEVTNVSMVTREIADEGWDDSDDPNAVRYRSVPDGVEVFEISGPFFFGAAEQFRDTLGAVAGKPRVLIIRMRDVPAIDATGIHALHDLSKRARKDGTLLLLSDVHAQPMFALARSEMLAEVGEENLFGNIDDALDRARAYLGVTGVARPAMATPTVAREATQTGISGRAQ